MCHILSNENRFPRVDRAYYQVLTGSDSRAGTALMLRQRHANPACCQWHRSLHLKMKEALKSALHLFQYQNSQPYRIKRNTFKLQQIWNSYRNVTNTHTHSHTSMNHHTTVVRYCCARPVNEWKHTVGDNETVLSAAEEVGFLHAENF